MTIHKSHFENPHRAELLMPAGSLLKLKTAILYGADAVFAGTPDMSMRTKSEFTPEELVEGVKFAHDHRKRVYLTLNLISHNSDIEKLPMFLETIRTVKPDGLIIADPGIFQYVKEHAPELELQISTQASVCSWMTVDFWKKQGAELCVMAREVTFDELKEIREKCRDIKLEVFIHGSMCMTYSGRCLLSNFMAERRSNSGNCAHSCRWNYALKVRLKDGNLCEIPVNEHTKELFEFLLEEEFRPGELLPIEEDDHGSYILNSKDLCLMPKLSEYLALGIDSLKVEGRNKTNYYVGIVAHAYRRAIDDWYRDPHSWNHEVYMQELTAVQNRGYTLAFHNGRLTNLAHNFLSSKSASPYEFAGYIREWQGDDMIFEIKNEICAGDLIEFISPAYGTDSNDASPENDSSLNDSTSKNGLTSNPSSPEKRKIGQNPSLKPIRLRLQKFIDAKTGQVTEKVSAGQNKAIRIPKSFFSSIPFEHIKKILPELTIARKKTTLSSEEQNRLLLNIEAQEAEIHSLLIPAERKQQLLQNLAESRQFAKSLTVRKGPRMGSEGCCGKGCNGCLIYWERQKKLTKN